MINLCEFVSEAERMARTHLSESSSITDAIKILFMLNKLPKSYSARTKYVKLLQSMQGERSGLCRQGVPETAQVLSALSLLDAQLEFPPTSVLKYNDARKLDEFSDSLDWHSDPNTAAGELFSAFTLLYCSDLLTYDDVDGFIQMLYGYTDGDTGLIRSSYIDYHHTSPFFYLEGFFRYLMVLEYTHSPIHYPSRTLDTCIQFYDREYMPKLSTDTAYENLVWVYCISRTMRQTGYRYNDCKKRLAEYEERFAEFIRDTDFSDVNIRALLMLICIAAELQAILPGTIKTSHPLNNVLNKTTFL